MLTFAPCSGISSEAALLAATAGLGGLGWEQAFQGSAAAGEYRLLHLPLGSVSFIYLVGNDSPDSRRAGRGLVLTLALHGPSR